jgi:uncharacterized protein YoxC
MLSGGQVAGLIVAMFWAILVCFLAVVLLRLARLLGETTKMIAELGDHAGPLLDDMTKTVEQAGEQLDRVDTITRNMAGVSQNVSAVSTVVTSVVGSPLVKAAAFSYGVRRALGGRQQPTGHMSEQVATGRVTQGQRGRTGSTTGVKPAAKTAAKTGARRATKTGSGSATGKKGGSGGAGSTGAGSTDKSGKSGVGRK